jgi:hypothetical protein
MSPEQQEPAPAATTSGGQPADKDNVRTPRVRLKRAGLGPRPPEVAAGDIDKLFERMRTIAPPPKVDADWAKSFNLTDATIILNWLGLTKDGGVTDSGLWNRVRMPATRQASLSDLVRASYAKIFEQIDVSEATKEDLEGAFVNEYNLGDTGRYIRAFITFCRHAGIPVAASDSRPDATPTAPATLVRTGPGVRKATKQAPAVAAPRHVDGPLRKTPAARDGCISVSVEIPAEWTEEQIRERLAVVARVLAETDER